MFLSSFNWLGFLSLYSFVFLKNIWTVERSGYYTQQHTVQLPYTLVLFFVQFYKKCTFFRGSVLLDIAVCDIKSTCNRFVINYIFGSPSFSTRIYVRVFAETFLFLNSLSRFFNAATWLEREVYDMFGLFFQGNIDLRRILTDYGFNGFPLRKDFPLVGFVERQFSLADNIIITRPVTFVQEFRFID